jgi:ubiquinone/menaquinone biosynthesis C-methylase UbiE
VSFDALAPHYRWMEFLLAGEKLQRCRTAFLDAIPAARNILLVGEGHGRCLVECCRRFHGGRLVCVDASEQMLAQARRRLAAQRAETTQVEFIHADALNWSPSAGAFDLIATNFFLDCFRRDQLERVICRLATAAAPGASWLLADFQIPSGGPRRTRSRLILWAMYIFFRTTTRLPAKGLTSPDLFLNREGFRLHRRIEAEWGLLHSDWWRGPGESGKLA